MKKTGSFVQVGVTALRGPDGKYLPAVPIYVEANQQSEEAERGLIEDLGKLFAAQMKQYVDGCRAAGIAI